MGSRPDALSFGAIRRVIERLEHARHVNAAAAENLRRCGTDSPAIAEALAVAEGEVVALDAVLDHLLRPALSEREVGAAPVFPADWDIRGERALGHQPGD